MTEYPADFLKMLAALPGHEEVADAMARTESPVSLRFNPAKARPTDFIAESQADSVPWEPNGFYLPARPQFTFHPGLYNGSFYVQDASSMILGEAVRRILGNSTDPVTYLDACAAPGGKTTSALAALPAGSFVLANEFEPERCHALVENLQRWGATGYAVSRGDARKLASLGPTFDIAGADVPCSGEGMMRKNPTAVSQWSQALITDCAALQREIVSAVWKTVRPGGYLIYSTCTFNTIENEKNAEWIRDSLGAEPVDLRLAAFPGVSGGNNTDIPCARFLPGRVRGEGQFIAVFRKQESSDSLSGSRVRPFKDSPLPLWVRKGFKGLKTDDGNLYAVDERHRLLVSHIMKNLNVVVPGTHVAAPKGRDLMPAHALATSLALAPEAFPRIEVDYVDAMNFLRGESLRLPSDTPRGFILIAHGPYNLGWTNNLGSRANNLVPSPRRIRSPHIPDSIPSL